MNDLIRMSGAYIVVCPTYSSVGESSECDACGSDLVIPTHEVRKVATLEYSVLCGRCEKVLEEQLRLRKVKDFMNEIGI